MPASIAELRTKSCYIHPLGGRVLVLPTESPDEIGVGSKKLILPETSKEAYPTEGEVLDVGPDVPMVPKIGRDGLPEKDEHGQEVLQSLVKPGDRVVYSRYTGSSLKFADGVRFIVLPYEDIFGLLDPECPVLEKKDKESFVPR